MPNDSRGFSHLWKEVKRRNVLRSLAIYAGTAFIILEATTIIFPRWNFPEWSIDLVLWLLVLGAVINIFVAWFFDLTPQGMQKTKPMEEAEIIKKPSGSKGWKAATYLSLIVIVALIVLNIVGGPKQLRAGDIQSLVILPFDNYTGDDELEYFVAGMHSSLVGDMGRISGLRVIGKTSSNMYKEVEMSASDIASELNVDAVVEASVMCLGDSICLQFSLVSTTGDEEQLWVAEYKEEKSQILNLYNRVTKQIADEVLIELTEGEEALLAKTRNVDKDAYAAYLQSHLYWEDLSEESLNKAIEYLTEAVEKDPDWAPPYAGLAKVWAGLAQMGHKTPDVAAPMIFGNIARALKLDPNLPDIHFTVGIIAVWMEWNWEKGEQEFIHALDINPNDAMSRIYYAHLLMILQRNDEALVQGQLAASLDPLNPLIQSLFSHVVASVFGNEEAYEQAQKAIALDPEQFFANSAMETYAFRTGNYDQAIEALKISRESYAPELLKSIEDLYVEKGIQAAWEEHLHNMELHPHAPYDIAMAYMQVKQYEQAMEWLEKGFEMHDPNMPYISAAVGGLDPLYNDPRFIAILEKMNLPPPKK